MKVRNVLRLYAERILFGVFYAWCADYALKQEARASAIYAALRQRWSGRDISTVEDTEIADLQVAQELAEAILLDAASAWRNVPGQHREFFRRLVDRPKR
jgi:hypothetical protein